MPSFTRHLIIDYEHTCLWLWLWSILWSPMKNRRPQNFRISNFGYPVSKSCLSSRKSVGLFSSCFVVASMKQFTVFTLFPVLFCFRGHEIQSVGDVPLPTILVLGTCHSLAQLDDELIGEALFLPFFLFCSVLGGMRSSLWETSRCRPYRSWVPVTPSLSWTMN